MENGKNKLSYSVAQSHSAQSVYNLQFQVGTGTKKTKFTQGLMMENIPSYKKMYGYERESIPYANVLV